MPKLQTIMVGTEDPKVLADFYTKVLGAPTWEDGGYTGWDLGGAGFMIGAHSDVKGLNGTPGRMMWNLETDDVKGEFKRIKDAGAKVIQEPYQPGGEDIAEEFWMATFADPDGNYFQIASPPPPM